MTADRLSTIFQALADPTRRAILFRLRSGEATVGELAEPFALSLPAISRHLKVLETVGLITRGRDAQWRPCRLEAGPLKEVVQWIAPYQRHWLNRFDRLDKVLHELQAEPTNGTSEDKPEAPADVHAKGTVVRRR